MAMRDKQESTFMIYEEYIKTFSIIYNYATFELVMVMAP
jgi:hypothetical protein